MLITLPIEWQQHLNFIDASFRDNMEKCNNFHNSIVGFKINQYVRYCSVIPILAY